MDKICKSVCKKSHVIVCFDVGVLRMWLSIIFLEQWANETLKSLSGSEMVAILLVFSNSSGPTCLKNKDTWVLQWTRKAWLWFLADQLWETRPSKPDTFSGEIWKNGWISSNLAKLNLSSLYLYFSYSRYDVSSLWISISYFHIRWMRHCHTLSQLCLAVICCLPSCFVHLLLCRIAICGMWW